MRACPPALTVIALLASLLASAPAASAQPLPTKTARIGLLGDVAALFNEAFRKELCELGWVEGQNLTIERRVLGGKYEQLPTHAADLVRLKMDVIVTSTPPAARRVRGPHPEGCQAGRSPRRAGHEVRAGRQPQGRENPRPDNPAVGAESSRPRHRVIAGCRLTLGDYGRTHSAFPLHHEDIT